jgi:predicted dehydrogenase
MAMSVPYRAALIGLGKIAYAHLRGYQAPENAAQVRVVAGADPSDAARQRFAAEAGQERMYADYRELLERERPDIVSICTWPPLHAEMVEAAAAAGARGILCEKPMAVDLAGCDRMLAAAERAGAVLIIGHQRRLLPRYTRARELIESGAIGDLVQVTTIGGGDLLTDGTHGVDLLRFLVGDAPAEWVIGNIDLRERQNVKTGPDSFGFQEWEATRTRYGHPVETGAVAMVHFAGGVRGTIETGICARAGYQRMLVYGTEGLIQISGDRPLAEDEPPLRARVRGEAGWLVPELPEVNPFAREISLLLESIEQGAPHPLDGRSARAGHEILMAIFESARRRARIDLPLDIQAHPLQAMVSVGRA